MLRIWQSNYAVATKKYFTSSLEREDYAGTGHNPGLWFGLTAERLGLRGQVLPEVFARLCDNEHPTTGEPLTPRTKHNRRVGYDFNFHCPKSVSTLYALGYDDRILEVFHEAVRYTMGVIERSAQTRVRVNEADEDRVTGNFVWAEFTHFTARPVQGVADPHLHAHCFVFNTTFDTVEQRFKAAQFGKIKSDAPYYEVMFTDRLAANLRSLGYEISPSGKYWEIEGVPSTLIDTFSTRTRKINQVAQEQGIDDPKEKARLGARTREAKGAALSFEDARERWKDRTSDAERESLKRTRASGPRGPVAGMAKAAVAFAIETAFERTAVVPETLFMQHAMSKCYGKVTEAEVRAEMARVNMINRSIDGKAFVTTAEVFAEESQMIEMATKGRGKFERLLSSRREDQRLNDQQLAAVRHAFSSRDFVTIIEGRAGTGKTTLLTEIKHQVNAASLPVSQLYLSPTTRGRERLMEEGFNGAATVAAYLTNPKACGMQNAGIVFVDEAGMVGTKVMLSLMKVCWSAGHRLVLVGDSRQNLSQSRGNPLRVLTEYGGVSSSRVEEIVRQSGALKSAVTAISEGRMEDGLGQLDKMGAITEAHIDEATSFAAMDYIKSKRAGLSTILVTPSSSEREAAEDQVRPMLKASKDLGRAKVLEQLVPKEMTDAAKARHESYAVGDVIEFHQNTKRGWFMPKASYFGAGTRWEVYGHDLFGHAQVKRIRSADPFGIVKFKEPFVLQHVPIKHADCFTVFRKKKIEVCVGDTIRITKNAKTHSAFEFIVRSAIHWATFPGKKPDNMPKRKLVNGTVAVVKRHMRGGKLLLDSGLIVPKDFGHIEYGYCTSAVKAQGSNLDRAIVLHTRRSGRAGHCRQVYVSVSRGADSVVVYTDSKEELVAAARTEAKDWNALDLMAGKHPPNLVKRGYEAESERRQAERERVVREKQQRGRERV